MSACMSTRPSHPTYVKDEIWDGLDTMRLISVTVPQSYLTSTGNNTVKIEVVNDQLGRAADIVRVDWTKIDYQHTYVAANDQLTFGGDATGPRRYFLFGFSTQDVDLYDVTDAAHVTQITGATFGPATTYTYLPLVVRQPAVAAVSAPAAVTTAPAAPLVDALRFGDNQTTPRRYLAQSPARRLTPLSIALDQPSNLQAARPGRRLHHHHARGLQGRDAAPGVTLRTNQGLRVQVVDVQDIYDEFGGGLMSAEAIRDFIAYAYNNWTKPAPKSILLVGDATYDLRHYKYAAPTFIPPYLAMVDSTTGETAADNRFVAVTLGPTGYDILPDLDIGRLPANSPAETTAMVNKILAYEALAPDPPG